MPNSGQNWQFFVPCDLEIQQITLNNNLLCYFNLCPSFHRHQLIETRITVWKRPNQVKIVNFLSHVTLNFDGWPWKTIGHLFYAISSFVNYFVAICDFKLELQSGKAQIGEKIVLTFVTLTFDLWPWSFAWTSLLPMVITPGNFMMIRWQKHCEKGVTDRQTDGLMDRQTEMFLELLGST